MERINKENKEKVMDIIEKAGSEEYETSWDEKGMPNSKKKSEIKKGRISRAQGARFELKVRKDLESKGNVVSKWNNNVDLEKGEIVVAKRKFNPYNRALTIGTGFPDFISYKQIYDETYRIMGVEVKVNGILSKEEKEKCRFLLDKKIFSRILIAKKGEKRGEVEYMDFKDKYEAQ